MGEERQLVLINTEAQMWVKPHVARYLRIIDEIKLYQETGVWPANQAKAVEPPKIQGCEAEIVSIDEMGDMLVKMLEEQS